MRCWARYEAINLTAWFRESMGTNETSTSKQKLRVHQMAGH